MQYYSTKQFSELTGWCTRVLKKWRKNGKLVPDIIEPNGYCKYSHEQLVNNMKPVNGELVNDIQRGERSPLQTSERQSQRGEQRGEWNDKLVNELVNEGVNSVQTSEQRGERNDKLVNDKRGEHPQTSERSPLQTSEKTKTATTENKNVSDFFQNTQAFLQNGQSEKIKTAHREAATFQDKNTTSKQKSKDPAANLPASHFKPKKKGFSYSDWIRQRKELAEQAKPLITNLLYELGVENLSRNFRCINPAHNDSTPSMTYYADTNCVHCHGCGFHGNIFNVYSAVHNMPINKALFDEVFAKFGLIDYTNNNIKLPTRPKITPVEPPKDAKKELVDRSADINSAIANIHLTDYWQKRGFNLDAVQHFRMGYAPQWKHPDFNTPPSDRLIVPTGDGVHSYLARNVRSDGNYKVLKVGGKVLFNLEGLNGEYIIVNEGEFDAISTWQVGFHNVVGLGGVGNKDKFVEAVAALTVKPKFVIIALDNDDSGIKAANWIHSELEKLHIYSDIINDSFGNDKDANALLQRDSDALKVIYDNAIEQADNNHEGYQFPDIDVPVDDDFDIIDLLELSKETLENLMYFNQTEAGNAERLVEAYGQKLIYYLTDSGRWLNFDGCQWVKASDTSNYSITNLVVDMARQLRIFANNKAAIYKAQQALDKQKVAESLAANMRNLELRKGVDNTIYFAKGLNKIRITNEDLNTHKTLLNCPNGVVDLETGKLMQSDSSLLITQCTNAYYIPNYHNELLERTLHQIIPDEETFDQFFLFLAYGLTGLTDEEKAAFIRGRGGNGKGTVTKLLMKALGNYAVTLPADILLMASYLRDGNAPTPELAKLELIRLAICDEIPPGRKMDIAKFKWLTGSDFLTVRELHRDPRMIDPMFKLILSGNHLPEIDDANDVAIKRRLIVYPFTQDFTQTGDPKLKNELMNQDPINGLMTLLVNYCTRYFKEGLGVSAAMQQARDEYLEDNDSIGQFIAENCDFDADSSIQRKDFIERIRRSGVVSGMTDKSIIDAVNKINGITYKKSSNDGGARRFFGIKWRDNNPSLEIVSPPNDSDNPF